MLAAVRTLNRLELVGETPRAALNHIAVAAPDWLRAIARPDWHERYDRQVEDMRLPDTSPKREAYAAQVGSDGFVLPDASGRAGAPVDAAALPEVAVLRRLWARHFERDKVGADDDGSAGDPIGSEVRMRPVQSRGPGDRLESPYDIDARFRSKRATRWPGYMVHLTETCDEEMPRLVVTPTRPRPTCTKPNARQRSMTRSPSKACPRPSTWWTPPTSVPATSSPPARGTG